MRDFFMPPHLTLDRAQAEALIAFCQRHDLPAYFLAKDHGAYIGATKGDNRVIHYFPDCNPETDANWYDACRRDFGGDDFGEFLPVDELVNMLADSKIASVRWMVTDEELRIDGLTK